MCGGREIHTNFLIGNLLEVGEWEVLGLGAIIKQKWDFYKR
jgi:hypothetical protein